MPVGLWVSNEELHGRFSEGFPMRPVPRGRRGLNELRRCPHDQAIERRAGRRSLVGYVNRARGDRIVQ